MIHDATVEVTCDNTGCAASEFVPLPAGPRDTYLARDGDIEKGLSSMGWVCKDSQQFCCQECADEYGEAGKFSISPD